VRIVGRAGLLYGLGCLLLRGLGALLLDRLQRRLGRLRGAAGRRRGRLRRAGAVGAGSNPFSLGATTFALEAIVLAFLRGALVRWAWSIAARQELRP
jgi:hypothetical protein